MIESLALLRKQHTIQATTLYHFEADDPRRLNHLSLEQQNTRAKALMRQWHSDSSNTKSMPGRLNLGDAQLKIANGYGFHNWSDLKAHIEQSRIACDALNSGKPSALDAGQRVLHIRCGSDIRHALVVAGFVGDFLVFSDPYVHGPVPLTTTMEEFIHHRATFLSDDNTPPYDEVLADLTSSYDDLERARHYDAVYLWFEHDAYDQLILAKLLDFFSDISKRPPVLRMICVTHYPGVDIFNGIGQLPPEAMRVLWCQFTDVTTAQLAVGQQAWAAIRAPTPQALIDLVATGTAALPTMSIALQRHLKQLPSGQNGLSLTEQLSLQILADKGSMNAARLFGWYTNHYEPLPFMGDTGYWAILEELADAESPAIDLNKKGLLPKDWQVSLMAIGAELLANQIDWLNVNKLDRWVGGIHIDTQQHRIWRWAD